MSWPSSSASIVGIHAVAVAARQRPDGPARCGRWSARPAVMALLLGDPDIERDAEQLRQNASRSRSSSSVLTHDQRPAGSTLCPSWPARVAHGRAAPFDADARPRHSQRPVRDVGVSGADPTRAHCGATAADRRRSSLAGQTAPCRLRRWLCWAVSMNPAARQLAPGAGTVRPWTTARPPRRPAPGAPAWSRTARDPRPDRALRPAIDVQRRAVRDLLRRTAPTSEGWFFTHDDGPDGHDRSPRAVRRVGSARDEPALHELQATAVAISFACSSRRTTSGSSIAHRPTAGPRAPDGWKVKRRVNRLFAGHARIARAQHGRGAAARPLSSGRCSVRRYSTCCRAAKCCGRELLAVGRAVRAGAGHALPARPRAHAASESSAGVMVSSRHTIISNGVGATGDRRRRRRRAPRADDLVAPALALGERLRRLASTLSLSARTPAPAAALRRAPPALVSHWRGLAVDQAAQEVEVSAHGHRLRHDAAHPPIGRGHSEHVTARVARAPDADPIGSDVVAGRQVGDRIAVSALLQERVELLAGEAVAGTAVRVVVEEDRESGKITLLLSGSIITGTMIGAAEWHRPLR